VFLVFSCWLLVLGFRPFWEVAFLWIDNVTFCIREFNFFPTVIIF